MKKSIDVIALAILLNPILKVQAQQWTAVPLITKTMKDQGYLGGEGCQVVQAIECDQTDGSFLLMGTDVGGIYRSIDGGKTFVQKSTENITDMDVVQTAPDKVFFCTASKFFVSTDGGETFTKLTTSGFPSNAITLNVSQANPDYMAVCFKNSDWGGPIYYSNNGGVKWSVAARNNDQAFMPYNGRDQKMAWHPTDANKVWALGGDWISSSKDAGKNFVWDANGYNGILVGGFFNFNIANPNLLFVGSQDYNRAFSKDNGQTWKYCNASNLGWGGFTYGEKEVFGTNGNNVVKSTDKGDTSTIVATFPGDVQDIAVDHVLNRLYVVVNSDRLFQFDAGGMKELSSVIPKDQYNGAAIQTVATDPNEPKIAYCAGAKNVYKSDGSVRRSIDSGKTWQIITPNNRTNKGIEMVDGANEVFALRVNPLTRELWAAGSCYGIWKEAGMKSLTVNVSEPVSKSVFVAGSDLTISVNTTLFDQPISKVEFYNDTEKIGESSASHYQFIWAKMPLGNYKIKAKVTDSAGQTAESAEVEVTVQVSLSPEVVITAPTSNSFFAENSNISISATATDKDGSVSKVEFFKGTEKLGESLVTPFTFEWKNVAEGDYILTAKATNDTGMTTVSLPVSVFMNGSAGQLTYTENFDDGLAQDWQANGGIWKVENKQYHSTTGDGIYIARYEGSTFYNYTYSVRLKPDWGNIFGVVFNYTDDKNYFRIELGNSPRNVSLIEVKNGSEKILSTAAYSGGGQGVYSSLKITNDGKISSLEVNGKVVFAKIATTSIKYGKIGLYAWWQPVWYDDIEVVAETPKLRPYLVLKMLSHPMEFI